MGLAILDCLYEYPGVPNEVTRCPSAGMSALPVPSAEHFWPKIYRKGQHLSYVPGFTVAATGLGGYLPGH